MFHQANFSVKREGGLGLSLDQPIISSELSKIGSSGYRSHFPSIQLVSSPDPHDIADYTMGSFPPRKDIIKILVRAIECNACFELYG